MPDNIQIQIFGTKELLAKMEKLQGFQSSSVFRAALEDAKDAFVLLSQRAAPHMTGRLRAAIHGTIQNFGSSNPEIRVGVGSNLPYAEAVEMGAPSHAITPRNRRFLHWYQDGRTTVQVPYGFKGDVDGYTSVFAKHVNHPGVRSRPFLFPQLPIIRERLIMALQRILNEHLSR